MWYVWYDMSFILKRNFQIGMDVVLTSFHFTIFVIWLCRVRMTSADTYAYFCCCDLVRYYVVCFVEPVVASGKFSAF